MSYYHILIYILGKPADGSSYIQLLSSCWTVCESISEFVFKKSNNVANTTSREKILVGETHLDCFSAHEREIGSLDLTNKLNDQ